MTIVKDSKVKTFKVLKGEANVRFPLFSIAAGEGKCPREAAARMSAVCLENHARQCQPEVGAGLTARDIH